MALVDVVATGGTLGKLIALLLAWADDEGVDRKTLRRRLGIVGLTERTHTSPNTWRWQQHSEWARQFPPSAIKNVSVETRQFHFIAAGQPKVSSPHPPRCWADDLASKPTHTAKQLEALRLARTLFERGNSREERRQLSALLAKEPAMRESWCRGLVSELRGHSARG